MEDQVGNFHREMKTKRKDQLKMLEFNKDE